MTAVLTELAVRDLGVIESLSLTLEPGMTALTGETGAGKTLLVEAIELLTGGRADGVVVRPGAAEAVVEGRFLVDGEERILSRAVPASGRSRAYLDGRMAPVSALAELAEELVDLHGQHSHQSLLRGGGQRAAVDAFAGVDLGPLRRCRARVQEIEVALQELGGDGRARARELDLLAFQLEEIDAAGIADPGEEAALESEEDLLVSAEAHRQAAERARSLLSEEQGAADAVGAALAACADRPVLDAAHRRLRSVAAELADVAEELRGAAESIQEDPERLEEVRGRRHLLRDLRRKYGESLEEVMAYADEARRRRAELEGHESAVTRLEAERREAEVERAREEQAVGRARREAAPRFAKAVGRHLKGLAMPSARFEVEVGDADPGDAVTFLLSANPGSPPLPLTKVASGGELARVMLAARLVFAAGPPVLVFDEVDAGVGGEAAVAVGRALAELARAGHQVLVVTHLAQVAAFADHQVAVRKVAGRSATRTDVAPLDAEARVVELSRMLAGRPDSASARDHAKELLEAARRS
ncbi:MAG TPA: DNA repair protein RecN [Acidimicrobiales bacterium]|nr:DNA repair protein RecN [Acidimicrobiales bacterium]